MADSAPDEIARDLGLKQIVTQDPALRTEIEKIPTVAASSAAVLILGETGTGKEMVARVIHYLSPSSGGPFVPVNCGAIPVELIENELFGHERAAFTGAESSRSGLVAAAENGTLFFDEVDSLPPLAQVKLLRFLENKEYRRLGSARLCTAKVRVLAASNVDLGDAVEQGRLRRDLYHRLNVLELVLPPLRARRGDIPLLAAHFLRLYSQELGKGVREFTPAALQRLIAHDWPGNVRELENIVQRAVILAGTGHGPIDAEDVSMPHGESHSAPESFQEAKKRVIDRFERSYVESLLEVYRGNISQAARAAKKDRKSFWQLIRKHRIEAVRFRSPSPVGEFPLR